MGVADITSRCAPAPSLTEPPAGLTPKRCCSSVMTMPRRANSVVWDSRAWVPMASSACPPARARRTRCFSPPVRLPVRSTHRTPRGSSSPLRGTVMLLRQDFRRRHQGRLHPVSRRPVGGSRRHHGFSGAHIPLEQPVHGHAPAQVPGNLLHSPPLGPGQGKWQSGAERLQLQIFISSHLLHRPPGPHQAEACGKYKNSSKTSRRLAPSSSSASWG